MQNFKLRFAYGQAHCASNTALPYIDTSMPQRSENMFTRPKPEYEGVRPVACSGPPRQRLTLLGLWLGYHAVMLHGRHESVSSELILEMVPDICRDVPRQDFAWQHCEPTLGQVEGMAESQHEEAPLKIPLARLLFEPRLPHCCTAGIDVVAEQPVQFRLHSSRLARHASGEESDLQKPVGIFRVRTVAICTKS